MRHRAVCRSLGRRLGAARATHTTVRAVAHLVGHALGGRGGELLLARLSMEISEDTILRLLKPPLAAPLSRDVLHVVGIDDWAWQEGQHHYGTIPVDVERRQVVDVLPTRTADAVAAWLAAHPDIVIISRDRHGPYATRDGTTGERRPTRFQTFEMPTSTERISLTRTWPERTSTQRNWVRSISPMRMLARRTSVGRTLAEPTCGEPT